MTANKAPNVDVIVTSLVGNILSHMVITQQRNDTFLPYFGPTRAGIRTDHPLVA